MNRQNSVASLIIKIMEVSTYPAKQKILEMFSSVMCVELNDLLFMSLAQDSLQAIDTELSKLPHYKPEKALNRMIKTMKESYC